MARPPTLSGGKPLHWVGASQRDFLAFPEPVKSDMGYALGLAQLGGKHPHAKPWKGEGAGLLEAVENHDSDTSRAVYTVRCEGVVSVQPAFPKKTPPGKRTAMAEGELIADRLKRAGGVYKERR